MLCFLSSYLNCVWCFHLTEQHKSHHLERCETALQVPMIYGALVEAMITFLSRYVALHSERWDTHVANYTNSIGLFDKFFCFCFAIQINPNSLTSFQ